MTAFQATEPASQGGPFELRIQSPENQGHRIDGAILFEFLPNRIEIRPAEAMQGGDRAMLMKVSPGLPQARTFGRIGSRWLSPIPEQVPCRLSRLW